MGARIVANVRGDFQKSAMNQDVLPSSRVAGPVNTDIARRVGSMLWEEEYERISARTRAVDTWVLDGK